MKPYLITLLALGALSVAAAECQYEWLDETRTLAPEGELNYDIQHEFRAQARWQKWTLKDGRRDQKTGPAFWKDANNKENTISWAALYRKDGNPNDYDCLDCEGELNKPVLRTRFTCPGTGVRPSPKYPCTVKPTYRGHRQTYQSPYDDNGKSVIKQDINTRAALVTICEK